MEQRKTVHFVGAVIMHEGKVFAAQRGYGAMKDGWEFPGGKIEAGESEQQAVVREIREELDTVVEPLRCIGIVDYDYPDFHLHMPCWLCVIKEGSLHLLEHENARWLNAEELDDVDWLSADRMILENVRQELLKEDGIT